jgi:ABC-type transport system substrate-binding protein/methyl-accepting chemotaxis protein
MSEQRLSDEAAPEDQSAGSRGEREDPLGEALARIGAGDLTSLARPGNASDERLAQIARLGHQLRHLVQGLRRAAVAIEAAAGEVARGAKGLSRSVQDEGTSVEETSSSIAEINVSLRRVDESIAALSSLAQATSASTLEMATSIDEVSDNAESVSTTVEEMASAIEEMAVSIQNVAANAEALATLAADTVSAAAAIDESTQRIDRSANETTSLADDVMRSAQTGSTVVYETARTMQSIKQAVDRANESMSSLDARSEQVGAITHVIDEIAERTNLLALNAAILAAQAGPQGRGFRIVADEIKELSERTAASTKEIAALIEAVRSDVRSATERVAAGEELAEKGVDQAYRAAAALDEISNNTVRASHKVRAIAEATSVQTQETHKVLEAAERVRERAQQIERATAEQASTSRHIGERAVHMSDLTEQVRRATVEQAEASKHIARAIEELSTVVEQIRSAVGEQSTGTGHVLRAIEVIKEVVARNQASLATINTAVDALGREAHLLRREFVRFKLPEPVAGGHLRIAFRDAELEMDPVSIKAATSAVVVDAIFETLVRSGESSEIRPGLAESWEVSGDGRVYTFFLREGATFHNGRPVTAEDVRYSFERALREGRRTGAWLFAPIEGAEALASGEAAELAGIEVLDERTLRITLEHPLAFFLSTLCVAYASIVPREEVERESPPFAERPVGSGPFRLVALEPHRRAEVERFDGWTGGDGPYVERVTFEAGVGERELADRFLAGELSYVKDPPRELVEATDEGLVLRAVQLHTERLIFDCGYPPFDNPEVRRAVAHAIDKERYVREAYGDAALVAAGPIPPGLVGYDPDYGGLEYDPDRARAALARAGFASGLKTSIWCTHGYAPPAGVARIVQDLAAVGVEAELREVDPEEFRRGQSHRVIPIAWRSWFADYADPDNFTYVLFHSTNHRFFSSNYANDEFDRLSERARRVMDREERESLYRRMTELLVEDAASVFLLHRRVVVVHRPEVGGMRLHLLTPIVRPAELWLEPEG